MPGIRQVGDWIGDRYEVFDVHQGGMGVVYEVIDHRNRFGSAHVALKTLLSELLDDRHRSARFAAECLIWVQLGNHPNIVQAHAIELLEGTPHIVLERVSGGELARLIGKAELDLVRSLRLGVEFCLGMEHAIRQGLRCHRDIKPGNLMITDHGQLKITDFGIAGIRDEFLATGEESDDEPIVLDENTEPQPIIYEDPRDRDPNQDELVLMEVQTPQPIETPTNIDSFATMEFIPTSQPPRSLLESTISRLTRTGVRLGTLPYMAPEQFRDAHKADIRADIYSFGVVLYQMLTGELPFKGNTVAKFERQHTQYLAPSVIPFLAKRFGREAEAIDALVHRCLAKNPADRFSDVAELRRALTASLHKVNSHRF